MAVHIRLTRVGATKQPTYRFVVADSRKPRDGRSLDTLGHYNPRTDPIEIKVDEAKARDWLSRGAKKTAAGSVSCPIRSRPRLPSNGKTLASAGLRHGR